MKNQIIIFYLLFILVSTYCYLGFRPFQFSTQNQYEILNFPGGIRFNGNGIAYSEKEILSQSQNSDGSISVLLHSRCLPNSQIAQILSLKNKTNGKIIIGQWQEDLLILKHNNILSKAKCVIKGAFLSGKPILLTITSNSHSSKVYINSNLVRSWETPLWTKGKYGRLVLGNSSTGKAAWQGEIFHIAFFSYELNKSEVNTYWSNLSNAKALVSTPADKIDALYFFTKKEEQIFRDMTFQNSNLLVPSIYYNPERQVIKPIWEDFSIRKSYLLDVVINLIGFIPFGILLGILLKGKSTKNQLTTIIIVSLSMSLVIEFGQIFLPSRESQMMDLVTNTLGSVGGWYIFFNLIPKFSRFIKLNQNKNPSIN